MSGDVQTAAPAGELTSALIAIVQLTKPAVTRLVMVTMASGALLAPGALDLSRLALALLGTVLVVAAANALNMYLERDSDAAMVRTRGRPLPSGRLSPKFALWFGVALAWIGIAMLTFVIDPLTALLAAIALLSYVLAYTPLKQVTPWALHVGAVPGAIPPIMGWTSMTGSIEPAALVLFAILFVWQLPHFCAIALFRQREYELAGVRVLPSIKGTAYTKRAIVRYLVVLLLVSLLPPLVGLGGPVYLAVAVVLGGIFLGWGIYGLRPDAQTAWARSLFLVSMPYLLLLFVALVWATLA